MQETDDGAAAGPFEDEDTRAFYESLPDVRGIVPAILLGESTTETSEHEPTAAGSASTDALDDLVEESQGSDAGEPDSTFHKLHTNSSLSL